MGDDHTANLAGASSVLQPHRKSCGLSRLDPATRPTVTMAWEGRAGRQAAGLPAGQAGRLVRWCSGRKGQHNQSRRKVFIERDASLAGVKLKPQISSLQGERGKRRLLLAAALAIRHNDTSTHGPWHYPKRLGGMAEVYSQRCRDPLLCLRCGSMR